MDEFKLPENFEEIWGRVIKCEDTPVPAAKSRLLEDFINEKQRAITLYQELIHRSCGQRRQTLCHILADERRHLGCLQLEYFMETGDSCVPGGKAAARTEGLTSLLREAYLAECASQERFKKAGCGIYADIANDDCRHAAILREMVAACFKGQG